MTPEQALTAYELVFGCPVSRGNAPWAEGEHRFCEELARALGYTEQDGHTLPLAQRAYIAVKDRKSSHEQTSHP